MRRVLIIGATSAIAKAVAQRYARQGDLLYLVGRDAAKLEVLQQHLQLLGAFKVDTATLDVNRLEHHAAVLQRAWAWHDGFDVVLIAHGTLPDNAECALDANVAVAAFHTNATATIALLARMTPLLRAHGRGTLAVISSVAGDRGRASNYLYGAAKAAVNTYVQGLRQALSRDGIQVLTIKPGFVDTPMTAHLRKGLLWAHPAAVAKGITTAIERRCSVVYLPGFWRLIMTVICAIPEPVFRRLKL